MWSWNWNRGIWHLAYGSQCFRKPKIGQISWQKNDKNKQNWAKKHCHPSQNNVVASAGICFAVEINYWSGTKIITYQSCCRLPGGEEVRHQRSYKLLQHSLLQNWQCRNHLYHLSSILHVTSLHCNPCGRVSCCFPKGTRQIKKCGKFRQT